MRRIVAVLAAAGLVGGAGAVPAEAAEVRIMISNFRYCIERPFPCDPADVGYVPGADGPSAAPVYSPITTADVTPGQTVTFAYADAACDALAGCPGHNVTLAGGTVVGSTPARSGPVEITLVVPQDAEPGSVIEYFCTVNGHFQAGMNGALRVS